MWGLSRDKIEQWLMENISKNYTHMLVVCDTFDYSDYPIFVEENEDIHSKIKEYSQNMQKVMEVYKFGDNIDYQIIQERCWNV